MRFQAVIFDLDGTLLDTERLVLEAGLEAMEANGHPPSPALMRSLIGVAEAESERLLRAHFGAQTDLSAFAGRWAMAVQSRYDAGIPLMPGVADLLDQISHLPRAVATNSATKRAMSKLKGAGLDHHFDAIIGYDLVARPKPAPDVFLEAAARLGVEPQHCLAFEDSDPGVASALAAGMTVVQVPDQHHSGRAGAHHLAASLLEGATAAGLL